MKSYLSMIPISAKVHKRQNRMTIWCIVIAVFLVTAVFSMTEMAVRQETSRLLAKHGIEEVAGLFTSEAFLSLLPIAALLFLFVLCAGVFMIAGSMNSNVAQRTQLFGMMRCVGMSKKQVIRYVRLEVLTYAGLGCAAGLTIGLLFSRWLYGFLVTSHYAYATWHLPVIELVVIAAFFALSVMAGIRAPMKRLNEMSITETISQL